jgi:hypothetical protein
LVAVTLRNAKRRDECPVGGIEKAGYFLGRAASNEIKSDKWHVYQKLMVFLDPVSEESETDR